MKLEFIFFEAVLRDRFVDYLMGLNLKSEHRDDHFGWIVAVPEDQLDDALMSKLEAYYEVLQDEQMKMVEAAEGGLEKHVAGFCVDLPDGNTTTVSIPPELANRLLANFSIEEVHTMFAAVAKSALQPYNGPVCKL
ncbi:MAG: hypothetical protein WC426_00390 [Sulfuriferula sp.]